MDFVKIFWVVSFVIVQFGIFAVNHIIWKYLSHKPIGMQTLLGSIMKDQSIGE